jgi:hypothetical protein
MPYTYGFEILEEEVKIPKEKRTKETGEERKKREQREQDNPALVLKQARITARAQELDATIRDILKEFALAQGLIANITFHPGVADYYSMEYPKWILPVLSKEKPLEVYYIAWITDDDRLDDGVLKLWAHWEEAYEEWGQANMHALEQLAQVLLESTGVDEVCFYTGVSTKRSSYSYGDLMLDCLTLPEGPSWELSTELLHWALTKPNK